MSGGSLGSREQRRVLVQTLTEPTHAADLAAESLRWLNHLLGRFEAAAEVYEVLSSLASCLERMPQALEGISEYMIRQQAAGALRRDDGGDLMERVGAVGAATAEAHESAWTGARALRRAQSALSDVYGPVSEGDDGRS
jgi:hypothetical protein